MGVRTSAAETLAQITLPGDATLYSTVDTLVQEYELDSRSGAIHLVPALVHILGARNEAVERGVDILVKHQNLVDFKETVEEVLSDFKATQSCQLTHHKSAAAWRVL